jgi:exo-beta-1,3-glucanase (GH17 family)
VTYGSAGTLAQIPRLAREAGFQAVIMGVWDIDSGEEIMNATLAAEYVDGYCLGNEGLHSRYSLEELIRALAGIKESTHKPATTTEQVADYANDNVLNLGDWIFPNIHPFLCAVKEPEKAARWIKKHYQRLEKHCPADKIVFFKEVGYPTSGMPEASERNQKKFFENMENSDGILFVYFEAFDQAWKEEPPCEPYWGLFTRFRKPKKYISSLTAD